MKHARQEHRSRGASYSLARVCFAHETMYWHGTEYKVSIKRTRLRMRVHSMHLPHCGMILCHTDCLQVS